MEEGQRYTSEISEVIIIFYIIILIVGKSGRPVTDYCFVFNRN